MTPTTAIQIDDRRELFVDGAMANRLEGGASLQLHQPTPRELIFTGDQPWEGNMCGFIGICQAETGYRLYYKAIKYVLHEEYRRNHEREEIKETHPFYIGCLESTDGLTWTRQNYGIIEHEGSKDNNIVWMGVGEEQRGVHGFTPFYDTSPTCKPEARYKAVGSCAIASMHKTLWGMQSPDGIHWELISQAPILRDYLFDSQNLAFWDELRGEYRLYMRDFRNGLRCITTAISSDFLQWSEPTFLAYEGNPGAELYTNQIKAYPRAPHLFVGFPARYVERPWCRGMDYLPEQEHRKLRSEFRERFGTALSDGLFRASRDGQTFRRWDEAFIRPGIQSAGNWAYGDNYIGCGMIETASAIDSEPDELSLYVVENYWREPASQFRRYSLRMDGFVSVRAPYAGGTVVTPPLIFTGERLLLNISTSAAGNARVQLETPDGIAIPGYGLNDCHEIFGDMLAYPVAWGENETCSDLAGTPVCLRIALQDADLYAFQFEKTT